MQRIITFRTDKATLDWLQREAAVRGVSLSQYMRQRLTEARHQDRLEPLLRELRATAQDPLLPIIADLLAEVLTLTQRLTAAHQPQAMQAVRQLARQLLRERLAEPRP